MDYIVILAVLSVGTIVGMVFTTIYTYERAKSDRDQIAKLNSEKINLLNENRKLKAGIKARPNEVPVDIEVIDIPKPDRTYHQPF